MQPCSNEQINRFCCRSIFVGFATVAGLFTNLRVFAVPESGTSPVQSGNAPEIGVVSISPGTGEGSPMFFEQQPYGEEIRKACERSMQAEAQRFSESPDRLIYVEYNGVRYPLKGWVKVQKRRPDGSIERQPLDEYRKQEYLLEQQRLQMYLQAATQNSLIPILNEIEKCKVEKGKLIAEQEENAKAIEQIQQQIQRQTSDSPSRSFVAEGDRLLAETKRKERLAVAISDAERILQIEQIRLKEFREAESQWSARLAELNETVSLGEPVYVPMRVDQGELQHLPKANERGVLVDSQGTLGTIGVVTISPKSTLGTSDMRQVEANGVAFARPEYALPAAVNSNDLFQSPLLDPRETRLGKERMLTGNLAGQGFEDLNSFARIRANPSFGLAYDTRQINSLSNIKALPTTRAAADGQTTFYGNGDISQPNVPLNLLFDAQAFDAKIPGVLPGSNEQQLQFFAETNNYENSRELRFRHLFGRIYDKGSISLAWGKTQTLFGTGALIPQSLTQELTLIGTGELGNSNVAQLRLQQNFSTGRSDSDYKGWGWGLAIEDPNFDKANEFSNVSIANGTILSRWPSLSGQLRFIGSNGVDTLQFGGLIRNIGMQLTSDASEQFETGWGLSAFGACSILEFQAYRCSAAGWFAGGEGIGRYINGVDKAAGFNGGRLSLLDGNGGFVGIQQRWVGRRLGWLFTSNAAFGYSSLDTESFLAANTNRRLQQAFANIYLKTNDYLQIGCEWQYGHRESLAVGSGDNNRFYAGLTLVTSPTQSTKTHAVDYRGYTSFSDRQLREQQGVKGAYAQRQRL